MESPRRTESFRPLVLPVLVVAALVLRLWNVRHGLPDFLEDAIPLRLALAMRDVATGAIDWNPHHFGDPSLGVYLHFAVQQAVHVIGVAFGHWRSHADFLATFALDPTPMVVAARLVGITADALTVVAVYRIGRRFDAGVAPVAAAFVALAPAMIGAGRSVLPDSVMTACAVWALERMAAWHEHGGARRLVAAATLAGLAAGARYPGAILVLPLALLAWDRRHREGGTARTIATACAIIAAAFLLTTPFALLDFAAFTRDIASGASGLTRTAGPDFPFGTLASNLGGPSLPLVAGSLGFAIVRSPLRPVAAALWLALAGFGVPMVVAGAGGGPAILPVLAIAAVLVAAALRATVRPFRPSVRRVVYAALLALTAGPAMMAGVRVAWSGADTTPLQARRWADRHLRPGDVIVQEVSSANLVSETQLEERRAAPEFQLASQEIRARAAGVRTHRVVAIPPGDPGRVTVRLATAGGASREIEVFPNAAALHPLFYDPRLFVAADYVMTSSAVRARFEADPVRFAAPCALYRLLDATTEIVARFRPSGRVEGPEIVVYHIGSRYRSAAASLGTLDPLWWTATIPGGYRGLAARIAAEAHEPPVPPAPRRPDFSFVAREREAAGSTIARLLPVRSGAPDSIAVADSDAAADFRAAADSGAAVAPSSGRAAATGPAPARIAGAGEIPDWVRTLTPFYDARIRGFAEQMTMSLARSGRFAEASTFALATLVQHPGDEEACVVFSVCARRNGRDAAARAAIERTLALRGDRPASHALRLEYARALAGTGAVDAARAELVALASSGNPVAIATEARRLLEGGR